MFSTGLYVGIWILATKLSWSKSKEAIVGEGQYKSLGQLLPF